tara:strand:- start:126 stop:575 length:450 start_codon:yes stop_codon:yes gene_type:complete
VDYLLELLQEPLDNESQKEIKGAIMRIWKLSRSEEIQQKMNNIGQLIKFRQYQDAEDTLSLIINEQNDFMDAYYQRAIIHYYQGEINQARSDLLSVLSLEPRHFDALRVLAFIYEKQNKQVEAYYTYKELEKILPHDEAVRDKLKFLKN